jgi:DNA-directed RNA polymerase specialized sigma subunit
VCPAGQSRSESRSTLFNFVKQQKRTAAEIAEMLGVSAAYVEYRLKQAGLHRVYKANRT